mgnify:CR=1 FL=1
MKQTARKVTFHLFARVLYDTFHNKGVKSASYFREKWTFHNSIVKIAYCTPRSESKRYHDEYNVCETSVAS